LLFAIININYIVSVTSSLPPWSSTKQNPTLFDFLLPLVSLWFQFYHCEYYIQYLYIFYIINKKAESHYPLEAAADTPIFLQPLLCPPRFVTFPIQLSVIRYNAFIYIWHYH